MKLVTFGVTLMVTVVSLSESADPLKCNEDYVGDRDLVTNMVQTVNDCEGDYKKMINILVVRFHKAPLSMMAMKFFKWFTVMRIPQDYRGKAVEIITRTLFGLPLSVDLMKTFVSDKVSMRIIEQELPDKEIISSDFLKDPLKSAVTVPVIVTNVAYRVYDVLVPVAAKMITDPSTVKPIVEHMVKHIRDIIQQVEAGQDSGLGEIVHKSGLGPKMQKIARIVNGPYPIEAGFWNSP